MLFRNLEYDGKDEADIKYESWARRSQNTDGDLQQVEQEREKDLVRLLSEGCFARPASSGLLLHLVADSRPSARHRLVREQLG